MSSNETYIVTTTRKERDLEQKARAKAESLGLNFVPRGGRPFSSLFAESGAKAIYIVTDAAPVVKTRDGTIFFHENTSGRRLKTETTDPLVRAMALSPGDTVLDCTLGLACDALVAAAHLDAGRVVGLERNPLLHSLVRDGLREYEFSSLRLAEAAARIQPVLADHVEYLRGCENKSFDVVYFDPFFEKTVPASASMRVMREVADIAGLNEEAVELARAAARKRVVIKCRRGEFGRVEFDETIAAGNRVLYGIVLSA